VQDEDDALLNEVLGITHTHKGASIKRTGAKPPKKAARLDIVDEAIAKTPSPASRPSKRDAMDELLAKHEADERYSAKLAHALDQISTETAHEMAPATAQRKARFLSLDTNEADDFHHETTYLVAYFSSSQMQALSDRMTPVAHDATESHSKPRTRSSTTPINTPENQELLNRLCSQPNAILKLPLLKAYLKRKVCPENVADWLIQILCRSKSAETAFEAYDALLMLLPVPANGWPAHIGKVGQVSVQGRSSTRNALPFVLDDSRIQSLLQLFGAKAKVELIKGNTERALFEASPLSASGRRRGGGLNPDEFFAELDAQTIAYSEESNAATVATEYQKLEELHASRSFNAYNFSLLALFIAASTKCGLLKMTHEELLRLLVCVYRAIVDPAAQSILSDLQILLISLLELLATQTQTSLFPRAVLELCEALWREIPEGSHRQFHATLYRWVYVTPCSTSMLRTVRAAMAFVLLQKQSELKADKSTTLASPMSTSMSSSSPSSSSSSSLYAEDVNYVIGKPMFELPQVIALIGELRAPGFATHDEWSMYSDWVLLIDVATACFNARDLAQTKRALTQWQSMFGLFHSNAKERGDYNLSRTRFKDLATNSAAILNIMANSVYSAKDDPMRSFLASGGTGSVGGGVGGVGASGASSNTGESGGKSNGSPSDAKKKRAVGGGGGGATAATTTTGAKTTASKKEESSSSSSSSAMNED